MYLLAEFQQTRLQSYQDGSTSLQELITGLTPNDYWAVYEIPSSESWTKIVPLKGEVDTSLQFEAARLACRLIPRNTCMALLGPTRTRHAEPRHRPVPRRAGLPLSRRLDRPRRQQQHRGRPALGLADQARLHAGADQRRPLQAAHRGGQPQPQRSTATTRPSTACCATACR